MYKPVVLISVLLSAMFTGFAQPDKIDTDRPDQTESTVTVPKKWIQLELGLSKQANNATEYEFQHPTLLSKYGITKRIEFRFITTLNTFTDNSNPNVKLKETGLSPVEAGAKIALWEEKKLLPKTSLIFHVGIPVLASKNFKTNNLAPNFRFTMQNSITKNIAIGYNLGAEWDGISSDATWIYTLAPGFNIGEKWYAYAEAFGFISKLNKPQHSLDGGIAYFVTKDLKLDLSSGFGISKAAPDWYFAIGGSIRFKTGK